MEHIAGKGTLTGVPKGVPRGCFLFINTVMDLWWLIVYNYLFIKFTFNITSFIVTFLL